VVLNGALASIRHFDLRLKIGSLSGHEQSWLRGCGNHWKE
jgi:hypothetical protein